MLIDLAPILLNGLTNAGAEVRLLCLFNTGLKGQAGFFRPGEAD